MVQTIKNILTKKINVSTMSDQKKEVLMRYKDEEKNVPNKRKHVLAKKNYLCFGNLQFTIFFSILLNSQNNHRGQEQDGGSMN